MSKKPIYTNELLIQIVTKKLDGGLDINAILVQVERNFPDLYREYLNWRRAHTSLTNLSLSNSASAMSLSWRVPKDEACLEKIISILKEYSTLKDLKI